MDVLTFLRGIYCFVPPKDIGAAYWRIFEGTSLMDLSYPSGKEAFSPLIVSLRRKRRFSRRPKGHATLTLEFWTAFSFPPYCPTTTFSTLVLP